MTAAPAAEAAMAQRVSEDAAAAPLPPTSLIICSRNRPALLLDSVLSVLKGTEVPTELIVVDQSDAPHPVLSTVRPVRGCEIRYLHSQVRGECPARNAGVAAARQETIVFTDDDVLVAPHWLGATVRALVEAGPRAVVTGQVLPLAAPDGFVPTVRAGAHREVFEGETARQALYTVSMAMPRTVFDEVGGFDERMGAGGVFPGGEDNDFGARLLRAGYRIVFVPESVVYHRAWREDDEYFAVRFSYGHGHGAFCGKHVRLAPRYALRRMAGEIGHKVRMFPGRLLREPRRALGDAVFIAGVAYGTARWLVTQRRAPADAWRVPSGSAQTLRSATR